MTRYFWVIKILSKDKILMYYQYLEMGFI